MKCANWALIALFFVFISCEDDNAAEDQSNIELKSEVNDFVWRGLNDFYLWKDNVPNLADTKDDIKDNYHSYLNEFSKPEDLFESLVYDRKNTDKYSWIVDDYIALEQRFRGVSKSNGVDFQLARLKDSDNLFAYVKYILPNSDAVNKNIKRGDLFLEVDGQQLTVQNYRKLLFGDKNTYELGLASFENNNIVLTGEKISLTKSEYTENPVYLTKIINKGGKKIGYLVYNSFTANFDEQLNNAFAEFKNAGVDELILDLRYNPGGRVSSAVYLASMITGQFNGQLLAKERWNNKWQNIFETQRPDLIINNFTDEIIKKDNNNKVVFQEKINSLNLNNVYVIITGNSASASELIINGLDPYIDVKLIGEQTEGKYIGSITIYDSDNFFRNGNNLNPNHKYAMQPITLEIVNKLGKNEKDGFKPTDKLTLKEDLKNMGVLGDENEPLLALTLKAITDLNTKTSSKKTNKFINYEKVTMQNETLKAAFGMHVTKNKEFYDLLKENK